MKNTLITILKTQKQIDALEKIPNKNEDQKDELIGLKNGKRRLTKYFLGLSNPCSLFPQNANYFPASKHPSTRSFLTW